MEIKLAHGTLRRPYGMVFDVYVILGTFTYQVDFVVMQIPEDDFYPIIFGRPLLNTTGPSSDCKREIVSLKCGEHAREFHFPGTNTKSSSMFLEIYSM